MKINKISDIQKLVVDGFEDWLQYGQVYTKMKGNLVLFNYLPQAQFNNNWTFLERVSRGLIIDKVSGEIVARPFDQFFNWMENNRQTNAPLKTITEKMDGSLGILYRDNGLKVATRGSFDGEQAQWATKFLNDNFDLSDLESHVTLLFEIIYPENKIVIDYGNTHALYLIGARNRFNGEYVSYIGLRDIGDYYGFPTPKKCNYNDIQDCTTEKDNRRVLN